VQDVIDVALAVARALDRAGVGYFHLPQGKVEALAEALGPDFEVDREGLRHAAREQRSWNIYALPLLTKIDLFVLGDAPFDRMEFSRRREQEVRPGQALFVKSAEDSVLRTRIAPEAAPPGRRARPRCYG
jgi:hypothetical protein